MSNESHDSKDDNIHIATVVHTSNTALYVIVCGAVCMTFALGLLTWRMYALESETRITHEIVNPKSGPWSVLFDYLKYNNEVLRDLATDRGIVPPPLPQPTP